MPQKKNQHYVPQFYMRNFSDDGKMIGVYLLKDKRYIPKAPIKNQASKDYMYSKDPTMENALSDLEGLADETIKKIISKPKEKLEGKDKEILLVFTLLQFGRTIAQTEKLQDLTDNACKQRLKAEINQKIGKEIDDKLPSPFEEVWDKMVFQLPNPGIYGVGLCAKLLPMCSDLRYKLLINKTGIDFVTSDNPTCMYDSYLERMEDYSVGLVLRGIEIYLPLSPKLAIMYYDKEVYKLGSSHKEYVEISDTHDVIELNKLVAINAKETLMCKERSKGVQFFSQYANLHSRLSKEDRVEEIRFIDTDNSIVTGVHTKAKFFKMKLNFLKELPRYAYKDRKVFTFKDRNREIAYHRNEILKKFEEFLFKKNPI